MYDQDLAREDIRTVLDSLNIEMAHVIGLSMGGFAALHFSLHYPDRVISQVISGCGYGAGEGSREQFQRETTVNLLRLRKNKHHLILCIFRRGIDF